MKQLIVDKLTRPGEQNLVDRIFYKNKPQAARNKGFKTSVDSKALNLKPWEWNYYSVVTTNLGLKF